MKSREHVRERIAAAFAEFELRPEVVRDIAFHMTDWKENLEQMLELYTRPEDLNDEQVQKIILVFLAHVPNHVAAAKKLVGLGPVEDIFGVGALEEDQEDQ